MLQPAWFSPNSSNMPQAFLLSSLSFFSLVLSLPFSFLISTALFSCLDISLALSHIFLVNSYSSFREILPLKVYAMHFHRNLNLNAMTDLLGISCANFWSQWGQWLCLHCLVTHLLCPEQCLAQEGQSNIYWMNKVHSKVAGIQTVYCSAFLACQLFYLSSVFFYVFIGIKIFNIKFRS